MLFAAVSRRKKLETRLFRIDSRTTDTTPIWERKGHIFRSPIPAICHLTLPMAIPCR